MGHGHVVVSAIQFHFLKLLLLLFLSQAISNKSVYNLFTLQTPHLGK